MERKGGRKGGDLLSFIWMDDFHKAIPTKPSPHGHFSSLNHTAVTTKYRPALLIPISTSLPNASLTSSTTLSTSLLELTLHLNALTWTLCLELIDSAREEASVEVYVMAISAPAVAQTMIH